MASITTQTGILGGRALCLSQPGQPHLQPACARHPHPVPSHGCGGRGGSQAAGCTPQGSWGTSGHTWSHGEWQSCRGARCKGRDQGEAQGALSSVGCSPRLHGSHVRGRLGLVWNNTGQGEQDQACRPGLAFEGTPLLSQVATGSPQPLPWKAQCVVSMTAYRLLAYVQCVTPVEDSTRILVPRTSFILTPGFLRTRGGLPGSALALFPVRLSFLPAPPTPPNSRPAEEGREGQDGPCLGCFLLAPPPGPFEASYSTPFCQARSLVKVTQTNTVSQQFVFRDGCFRRGRGSERHPHGGRSTSRAGTCPQITPDLIRHLLPQPRNTNIPQTPARETFIQECPSGP